jgi:glycosyltransferase involved in cell wall biosynthesis
MSAPLVSVVMIVRNGERFFRQAIESVLAQDYCEYEIIVVDGQSTDSTADIAHAYPQIRYVLQENTGVANAYNMGIAEARGELIAFLSHDDLWTPNKLSVQIGYMLEHPEIQYTITHGRFFLEPGYRFPSNLRPMILERDLPLRIMETLVARKEVFAQVGLFDPQVSPMDDTDWYMRAHDLGVPMAVLEQTLLHKRLHDTNTSVNAPENRQNMFALLQRSAARKRALAKK